MFKSRFSSLLKSKFSDLSGNDLSGNVYYNFFFEDESEYKDGDKILIYLILSSLIACLIAYFPINKMFSGEKANKLKIWMYVLVFLYPDVTVVFLIMAYFMNLQIS